MKNAKIINKVDISNVVIRGEIRIFQEQCSQCKRWNAKIDRTISNRYCSHCGAKIKKSDK